MWTSIRTRTADTRCSAPGTTHGRSRSRGQRHLLLRWHELLASRAERQVARRAVVARTGSRLATPRTATATFASRADPPGSAALRRLIRGAPRPAGETPCRRSATPAGEGASLAEAGAGAEPHARRPLAAGGASLPPPAGRSASRRCGHLRRRRKGRRPGTPPPRPRRRRGPRGRGPAAAPPRRSAVPGRRRWSRRPAPGRSRGSDCGSAATACPNRCARSHARTDPHPWPERGPAGCAAPSPLPPGPRPRRVACTPSGNRRSKSDRAQRVLGRDRRAPLCSSTSPVSRPSSGQKIERPVSVSPSMIGQLMELGPRCRGSSDGWYWMVPRAGMRRNSPARPA